MLQQIFWGIVSAIPVMIIVPLMRKYFSAKLIGATCLITMSFIYVGFALKENETADIILEIVVALLFYFIALYGFVKERRLIALGILLHGLWDSVHHFTTAATDAPYFWPVYCLTIDLIWSVYFYIVFRKQLSKLNSQGD